ncbi:MAG TPA: ABC transporter ATP-binding protein [Jiangellaceae bacterium]|nr:ABC transporter ATP-binding protein [Jiangellaceae bacterium]
MTAPLLEVRDLHRHYTSRHGFWSRRSRTVPAVNGVSFTIGEGETLGLVGESGCGKSTLARSLLFLEPPTAGQVLFRGQELNQETTADLRRRAQIVFQDPYTSLPPRMRIGRILAEPFLIHRIGDRADIPDRVADLLRDVGLSPDAARALPYELSGGQRQRVGIARALAVQPALIVADEAVSSLDVSVQAQILNLLKDLQARHRLAYLFISHDLGVVKNMSHRIAVMYLGKIVELADAEELYDRPLHPYTRALLSAVPSLARTGDARIRPAGEPPDPAQPPPGCPFHPRCPLAQSRCQVEPPALHEWLPGRVASCHFALSDVPPEKTSEPRGPAEVERS